MDLIQVTLKITKFSLLCCGAISLAACAAPAPIKQAETVISQTSTPVESEQKQEMLPLSAELVYYVLLAEIAGQRGEIGVATELYNEAANAVDSPALASRAAQVANYTRDKVRINRAIKRWLEVDPENPEVYVIQTPYLIMDGDFDALVQSTNKALALAPDKTRLILAQLADNLRELDKAEQSLDVFQKLDLYKQDNPDALYIYAKVAEFYKHYDPALIAVDKVLAQQPNLEDALILKADILQRMGQGKAAIQLIKRPATQKGASDALRFAYAKLQGENGNSAEARRVFEQINTDLPDNQEVIFALGLLALEDKNGNEAKQYFSQLISNGDPGKQAAYFMGLSEELEKNIEQALIWFSSVPADSPRFQMAQGRYINLLADNGQLDKARAHLKLLRKEQPNRAEHYYVLEGAFLAERGAKQQAFDLYTEALTNYPKSIDLLYGRAMVAEGLDKLDIFEQDLKVILAADPDNAVVLNALGYTLTDRTDRHQEALVLIKKAVALSPKDPFFLDSLGWVYYRLGQLDKAESYLTQAVELQQDAELMAHLGEVLWQQGKHDKAKKIWQKSLEKHKNNPILIETMRRFGL